MSGGGISALRMPFKRPRRRATGPLSTINVDWYPLTQFLGQVFNYNNRLVFLSASISSCKWLLKLLTAPYRAFGGVNDEINPRVLRPVPSTSHDRSLDIVI